MTEEPRYSPKRRRAYFRKFDHDEARKRWEAGESQRSIAAAFGVTRAAIAQALRRGDRTGLEPSWQPKAKNVCPTCRGYKSSGAGMCQACFTDGRIQPPQRRYVKTKHNVNIRKVENGRIVQIGDRYGVVERFTVFDRWHRERVAVYFWDGPAEVITAPLKVTVLPYMEVVDE